jgi:hypothetical protein
VEVQQVENTIEFDGLSKIGLKIDHDPIENKTKRTIGLSVEVGQEEAQELQAMLKQHATWSLSLTADAIQLPLEAETAEDPEAQDPESREEVGAGAR